MMETVQKMYQIKKNVGIKPKIHPSKGFMIRDMVLMSTERISSAVSGIR
jgi:hypothetical protein